MVHVLFPLVCWVCWCRVCRGQGLSVQAQRKSISNTQHPVLVLHSNLHQARGWDDIQGFGAVGSFSLSKRFLMLLLSLMSQAAFNSPGAEVFVPMRSRILAVAPGISCRQHHLNRLASSVVATEAATSKDSFSLLVGALWDDKDAGEAREILETGGVDLSARLNGKTALHYAALDGHTGLVQDMISRGAAIDVVDEQLGTEGMTPLIWAALNGHAETCQTLVELGADTSIREKGGMTAAEIAEAYDHDAVVAVLKS